MTSAHHLQPAEEQRPHAPDLDQLVRWIAAGGQWRVQAHQPHLLVVSLLTCDSGEEMARIESDDECFAAYVTALDAPRDHP